MSQVESILNRLSNWVWSDNCKGLRWLISHFKFQRETPGNKEYELKYKKRVFCQLFNMCVGVVDSLFFYLSFQIVLWSLLQ